MTAARLSDRLIRTTAARLSRTFISEAPGAATLRALRRLTGMTQPKDREEILAVLCRGSVRSTAFGAAFAAAWEAERKLRYVRDPLAGRRSGETSGKGRR